MTSSMPLLQKLMEGFGAKFDLRVVKHVDDAIIVVLRILDKEIQMEAEKVVENPENGADQAKEKQRMQSSVVTAISMALKSRAEIEMNLKYPYEEEFKNNILSSLPEAFQEILQIALSNFVPNSS